MKTLDTENMKPAQEDFNLVDPGFWDLIKSGYEALKAARAFRNQTRVVRKELGKVLRSIENLPYYEENKGKSSKF